MNLVLDASVVVKWLVVEPDTDRAEALLASCQLGRYVPIAPELLTVEVGNVLWRRFRQGTMRAREAESLFAYFNRVRPVLVPLVDLSERAFKLALTYQHSTYDCLYLALALERQCELITADEKFYGAFFPTHFSIKLLHDWK